MRPIIPASDAPTLAGLAPPANPLPFFQFVRALGDNVIAAYHQSVYEEWIVPIEHLGPNHFIVNHPAAIKRVLVENETNYVKGEMEQRISGLGLSGRNAVNLDRLWRARRRIVSSLFDYRSYPQYAQVVSDAALKHLATWQSLPPGTAIDLPQAMLDLASESIARVLFSSGQKQLVEAMERVTAPGAETIMDLADFVPVLNRLRRSVRGRLANRRFIRAAASIDQAIEDRRRTGIAAESDLLDRLISARDPESGQRLAIEELRLILTTLFAAGHVSAAQALTWTWYLLSQNPEQETKLHSELDSVLAGRAPTLADLEKLPYTRMVIEEALRLYPPFPMLAWREALRDDELHGVPIPRGATVSIVPWVLHRHRKLWQNPHGFDPERFSPARTVGRPQLAYLPFGAGPRVCLGAVFAMMEITIILATVAQRYRFRPLPGHNVVPCARLVLSLRHGLPVTLQPR
ncbi:MAG: cytochrome P450 [Terracidiphilus sp.]|jgi:cytochrome P450